MVLSSFHDCVCSIRAIWRPGDPTMFDLHLAAQAAPITIELPTAVSVAVWIIVALFGIIAWFLRREVKNNDAAHTELRSDVKTLLEAVGRIEAILIGRPQ